MTTATQVKELHRPNPQEIANRAYAIYLSEGKPNGHAVDHWLRAEKELRVSISIPDLPTHKSRAKANGTLAAAAH